MASYRDERRGPQDMPSLEEMEPGQICGAVIPMSERAQNQVRDSLEVVNYILSQEGVVWS